MLGGKRGAVAGGVGAALADIVSGYAVWAVPTLICKAVMALVMGALIKHHVFGLKGRACWIVAAVAGGVTQGIGYIIFWYFMFGQGSSYRSNIRTGIPDGGRNNNRFRYRRSITENIA